MLETLEAAERATALADRLSLVAALVLMCGALMVAVSVLWKQQRRASEASAEREERLATYLERSAGAQHETAATLREVRASMDRMSAAVESFRR